MDIFWIDRVFWIDIGITLILTALSVWDIKHYRLPNKLLLCLGGALLLRCDMADTLPAIDCASILFSLAATLKIGYFHVWRKHLIGWGDVKFLGICGLVLSWPEIPLFLSLIGGVGIGIALFWRLQGWGRVFPLGPGIAWALFWILRHPL